MYVDVFFAVLIYPAVVKLFFGIQFKKLSEIRMNKLYFLITAYPRYIFQIFVFIGIQDIFQMILRGAVYRIVSYNCHYPALAVEKYSLISLSALSTCDRSSSMSLVFTLRHEFATLAI